MSTAETLPPPAQTAQMASAAPVAQAESVMQALHAHVLHALGAQAQALRIERAVLGLFFTGVKLSNGVGGMCATFFDRACCGPSGAARPMPGAIKGLKAVDVLADLHRPQDLRRALAIATLNALAQTLWQRDGAPANVQRCESEDAFHALRICPGDAVVLVGAFTPYIRALRQRAQPFHVLELDPAAINPEDMPFYQPAERAPAIVPQADVCIITGTTLLNSTLDGLLGLIRPGAEVAVVGPTTTLIPGPYAQRGVTVLGGTRVLDADALLDVLAEGGTARHFFGHCAERVTLRLPATPANASNHSIKGNGI